MTHKQLYQTLNKIYHRPERPPLWLEGGNLPWNDPTFSERMLGEHLDQSHGAASRIRAEREMQTDWLWKTLDLTAESHLFDVTCGPGLYAVEFARRGCSVTGVDFGPASIAYAQDLAITEGVAKHCTFIEADVRDIDYTGQNFEAAILLYGQIAVFPPDTAKTLLTKIATSLKPEGKLCLEVLNPAKIDKTESTWWFTDDKGLWGEHPFLHLGERFWEAESQTSIERYHIIDLESGLMEQIQLCDQSYTIEAMTTLLKAAGFSQISVFPAWDGLPLYDADEWIVYLAQT